MLNDINNLDTEDIGLKGIFGDRFHDATVENGNKPVKTNETTRITEINKADHKPISKPRKAKEFKDADFEPAMPAPNQMDKLKSCAKSALLFGGLSLLFFYWQQTGQMALTASMPCICACCVLAGLSIGKNAAKGDC